MGVAKGGFSLPQMTYHYATPTPPGTFNSQGTKLEDFRYRGNEIAASVLDYFDACSFE